MRVVTLRAGALALALSVPLWMGACGSGEADGGDGADSTAVAEADTSSESATSRREKAINVQVSLARQGDLILPIMAEGTIRARHAADVKAEVVGRVRKILAPEGSTVSAGDPIVALDDREIRVAVDEARSAYFKALSTLAVEEGEITPGVEESAGNPAELGRDLDDELRRLREGDYRDEVVAARSGVAQARASLDRALLDLERTVITAPFDGVVSTLSLTVGQQVQLGETICRLVDGVHLEAELAVLESDLRGLAPGRPVLVGIPALADTLRATVDVISPEIDRSSRTCRVLVRLTDPEGRVRPGMYVRAAIAGEVVPDRLLVPAEAVLTRDGRPLVFKVEEESARWLYVELGRRNDSLIEIVRVLQGGTLADGEPVIISDHLTLAHGATVKIKRTQDSRDPWSDGR